MKKFFYVFVVLMTVSLLSPFAEGASREMIISGEFPDGAVNKHYNSFQDVTCNYGGYNRIEVISGDLPPGLRFDGIVMDSRIRLVGTPTTEGSYTFTIRLTNEGKTATKTFTIKIEYDERYDPLAHSRITGEFPNGTVDRPYISRLDVEFNWSDCRWTLESGDLPPGLELKLLGWQGYNDEYNDVVLPTGVNAYLLGTPTKAGTYKFTVRATSGQHTATKVFTIVIYGRDDPNYDLDISGSFSNGTVGTFYSQILTASGGQSPYYWTYKGTLPSGLEFDETDDYACKLSGTPTASGTYRFTVSVIDYNADTVTKEFSVVISAKKNDTPSISGSLSNGTVGLSYSGTLTVSGGQSPYTWSYSGTLPPGLSFKGSAATTTGTSYTLSGTPTTSETYSFTVSVTDNNGESASQRFSVTISNNNGSNNNGNNTSSSGGGGGGGGCNSGLGMIALLALAFSKSNKKKFLCVMLAVLAVMTAVSSSEALGLYEQTTSNIAFKPFYGSSVGVTFPTNWIPISGAPVTSSNTYTWSVASGSLPTGLYLACSDSMHTYNSSFEHNTGRYGHIAGTPTKSGSYTFTLRVDSSNGDYATNRYTITINGSGGDNNTGGGVSSGGGGGGCNSGLGLIALLALAFRRSR